MADLRQSDILNMDESTIIPHGDRYLVRKLTIDNKLTVNMGDGTKKTMLLAGDPAKEEEKNGYFIAEIVTGGNGHRMDTDVTVPMPFKSGDVVMVEKFSGREVTIAGDTFTVINQTAVLAHLPELEAVLRAAAEAA